MELEWKNLMGEAGKLKVGPFKYTEENKNEIAVEIVKRPPKLTVEEPSTIVVSIYNQSSKSN